MSGRQLIWWRVLVIVTLGLVLFGLLLVVLPGLAVQAFSLLIYASPGRLDSLGPEAVAYIRLVHAVLGAVMVGWGVVLLLLMFGPLRRGSREAWGMVVVSLLVWFIPDTAFSLLSGFWQNAVLNAVLTVFFAAPLIALRPGTQHERT